MSPSWVAQLVGAFSIYQKAEGLIAGQDTYVGGRFLSLVGVHLFLSHINVSLSLSLSKKVIKTCSQVRVKKLQLNKIDDLNSFIFIEIIDIFGLNSVLFNVVFLLCTCPFLNVVLIFRKVCIFVLEVTFIKYC